jgi:DUF4097 and DUF4098 domain-containing protein YvlB
VELPPGSHVEIDGISGDLSVAGLGGNVRLRATSGDVKIDRASSVDVKTVNGDVMVRDATGEVRVRTVSGDAKVRMAGSGAHLEFDTTSGDLEWGGSCGAGCRIDARSCSGDLVLALDPASSFDFHFLSHSGDLDDELHVVPPSGREGVRTARGRFGRGEGVIHAETFSGDLRLSRR